jgi:hypothetical protein
VPASVRGCRSGAPPSPAPLLHLSPLLQLLLSLRQLATLRTTPPTQQTDPTSVALSVRARDQAVALLSHCCQGHSFAELELGERAAVPRRSDMLTAGLRCGRQQAATTVVRCSACCEPWSSSSTHHLSRDGAPRCLGRCCCHVAASFSAVWHRGSTGDVVVTWIAALPVHAPPTSTRLRHLQCALASSAPLRSSSKASLPPIRRKAASPARHCGSSRSATRLT